jgi:hypothetical protein
MFPQRFVVVGIMLATLEGCVALSDGHDRVFTVDDQVTSVRAQNPSMIFPVPAEYADKTARNAFITERMYLIDLEFNPYFARLTTQSQAGNLAGDLAILGLTFSSTVLTPAVTKTALSAASTAVAGGKTAFDNDVLLSHTIQILLLQMETSRNHVRARIEANLQACSTTDYTVWQALTDLEDYYRAGTLPGALEALAAATGNNNQQSKDVKNGTTQTSGPAPTTTQSKTGNGASIRTAAAPKPSANATSKCTANDPVAPSAALSLQRQRQQQQLQPQQQ